MGNCAVVNADNVVVNIIVADPTDTPPEGCFLVGLPEWDIGYIWTGEQFIPPPQAE